MIASNSDQETRTEKECSPGGEISMLMGRLAATKIKDKEKKDPLGRFNLFQIEGNNKVLKTFAVCRKLESTTSDVLKSRAQCDRSRGEVKTSREHREAALK